MDLVALFTTFAVVFPAELPDKTMVASMVLSTRTRHPWAVWVGATGAFTCHVVIAVAFGSLLTRLPETPVQLAIAAMFAIGGLVLLREGDELEQPEDGEEPSLAAGRSARATAAQAFAVVFLAEWGDLTQLATASLAASTDAPLSVLLGAWLALVAVAALAVVVGRTLLRVLPVRLVRRIAAGVFFTLSVVTLVQLVRG